jgi:hypothetical protein
VEQSGRHDGSERSSLNPRAIHKNKYINKIRDLGGDEKGTRGGNEDFSAKSMDKKERNKQSAKLSRDRKKLYIEILEEKQRSLAKTLESRKKEL